MFGINPTEQQNRRHDQSYQILERGQQKNQQHMTQQISESKQRGQGSGGDSSAYSVQIPKPWEVTAASDSSWVGKQGKPPQDWLKCD